MNSTFNDGNKLIINIEEVVMKKLTKTSLSLAILAACSIGSAHAGIKNVNKHVSPAQVEGEKFSAWLAAQKPGFTEDATDQFIVEYNSNIDTAKDIAKMEKRLNKKLKVKKNLGKNKHIFKLEKRLNKKEQKEFLKALKKDKNIKFAEMDPMRYLMSQVTPWGIPDVQANQLSDSDASNMTVCIIDSGYERSNPDLVANNATGSNDSGTGNWYQAGGSHGTHVAGTIAAVNNTEGVIGVLPNTNVNLHIVKVFNESGWGYSSDLVTAVNTCANNGANVVNMSLGGPSASTSERTGLEAVTNQGVLLIAASGNDGNSSLSYPASYDTVMAVGAVDESGKHAEFSQYTAQVEVAAPGEAILSTVAGDGRLGTISVGSSSYGNAAGVVPQTHYIQSGSNFVVSNIDGSAQGDLASCTLSNSTYSCSNVNNNICVVERDGNQIGSSYPEIDPAKACADAGAAGIIVYSDTERPGLQNPFLVDATNAVTVPTVSVNRTVGQELLTKLGQSATLNVVGSQNYAYYNGTSMATPHVSGVAALAWSNNISCTAAQVRAALKSTAIDLDVAGRDDKTGYGLVQAKATSDSLAASCGGGNGGGNPPASGALENGVAKTNLSASKDQELSFTFEVPAGATDLSFDMSGGTGDADLYVKFGSEPTTSSYDCRSWNSGNTEACAISNIQTGTYHVKVVAYSTFSGAALTASYTEPSTGGATGFTGGVDDISASSGQWKYYTLDVPAGMSVLDVAIANGTGDADLYVRFGSQPTSTTYDCRPYESGNTEACQFNNPAAGTWHIAVRAYSTFSGVDLSVSYQP